MKHTLVVDPPNPESYLSLTWFRWTLGKHAIRKKTSDNRHCTVRDALYTSTAAREMQILMLAAEWHSTRALL